MTSLSREDIIRLSVAANPKYKLQEEDGEAYLAHLTIFAELVAGHERNECASIGKNWDCDRMPIIEEYVAAIEARGKK